MVAVVDPSRWPGEVWSGQGVQWAGLHTTSTCVRGDANSTQIWAGIGSSWTKKRTSVRLRRRARPWLDVRLRQRARPWFPPKWRETDQMCRRVGVSLIGESEQ